MNDLLTLLSKFFKIIVMPNTANLNLDGDKSIFLGNNLIIFIFLNINDEE